MRLDKDVIRLPYTFDAARLAEELGQFDESDWRPDLPLVSARGDPRNDAVKGPMNATPYLARCPYVQEVLASLRAPVGRTRLVRISANTAAEPRADSSYYALHRARVHVPIVTNPAVMFSCGDTFVHMAAGETWSFDTSRPHALRNPDVTPSVHLVADVVASPEFWERADGPANTAPVPELQFESSNVPLVMSPAEQEAHLELLGDVPAVVRWFLHDWRELWHRYGESPRGWAAYRALLERFDAALEALPDRELLRQIFVVPALNPELDPRAPAVIAPRRLDRPVFIVSSPRAGSTLLFQTLWRSPTAFATGRESHELIEEIEALHPSRHGWESNRLTAEDATPEIASELDARYLAALRARDGSDSLPPRVRMVEKTTKSLLRIPFLREIYPDALFICLYRDPRATISSLIDVWRAQTMVTYPELPGGEGPGWTLTLVPGWRAMNGKPLEEIVAHQWSEATRIMLDDLQSLDRRSWCAVRYETFVAEPQKEIERLCAFADLAWDRRLTTPLPHSMSTLTAPSSDKWRRNAEALDRIADRIRPVAEHARDLLVRIANARWNAGLPAG